MGVFVKNILLTSGTRCLQLVFGIGTSILIARFLGSEGRGIYAMVILLPAMLVAFTEMGIGPATVYYIGCKKYSPGEILGINLVLGTIIGAIAMALGAILVLFFKEAVFPNIPAKYLLLALIQVPFALILNYCSYVLLGLQRISIYNVAQLISTALFLVLLGFFWFTGKLGICTSIGSFVISSMLASISVLLQARRKVGRIQLGFRRDIIRDLFSFGIRIYASNVLSFLQYRLNFIFVNRFVNPAGVGIYAVAVSASEQTWIVADSSATVLFPKVASEANGQKRDAFTAAVCRNVMLLSSVMILLLELIGGWIIITMYSSEFSGSILPFRILLIGVVSIAGWRILANDIAGRGRPIINTYVTGGVVILNVLLTLILVPFDGIRGAAVATVLTYTAAFIICSIVYIRITDCRLRDILIFRATDLDIYRKVVVSCCRRFLPVMLGRKNEA